MKKLLTIIASALTLGAFAAAQNDMMITFDTSAITPGTSCLICTPDDIIMTAVTTGDTLIAEIPAEYSGQEITLVLEDGTPVSESFIGSAASAPMRIAKFAAPSTKMYVNALAGDAKVDAGTYSTITVADPGIAATHFDTTTAITGGSGTIANLFHKGSWGYINPHTLCGWFKVDALPESGDKTVYAMNTDGPWGNKGYRVAVTSEGKIKVGHCHNGYEDWNTGYTMGVSDEVCVVANTWYYMTVTLDRDTSIDGVASPTDVKVYLNGTLVLSEDDLFSADLGGNNFVGFAIGSGMTVAGLYVDTTVLDGTTADVLAFATSEDMTVKAGIVSRTLYLDASKLSGDGDKGDKQLNWSNLSDAAIVDADGNPVTDLRLIDTVVVRDNVNLAIRSALSGLKIVVDNNATVGFAMSSGMTHAMDGLDVEVKAGSTIKLTRAWGTGWLLDGKNLFNIKDTRIHGEGSAKPMTIDYKGTKYPLTVSLESSSIDLPLIGSDTVNYYAGMRIANSWTGTVVLGTVANWTNIGQYGNANSTVKFGGDFEGHLSMDCTIAGDLDLGGHTIKFSNGFKSNPYVINRLVGEGELNVTWGTKQPITITNVLADDGKTIAFTGTIVGNVTLTLPEGYELDAEGHIVKHVDAPTMPEVIAGGSEAQQTAYAEWAEGKVTDHTATGVAEAFALNLTATKIAAAESLEQAVKDELDELLKTIDADEEIDLLAIMQAVAAGTSNGTITLEGYENATIKLVPATLGEGIETNAELFKLSVEFNAKGQN